MNPDGLEFWPGHGHLIVFAWAFLVQLGLPLPALPMLLGAAPSPGVDR